MRYYYLDNMRVKSCESLDEWTNAMRGVDSTIEKTEIGEVLVSTVFLAVDHNFSFNDNSNPILFETMVFGGKCDGKQERYATLGEAKYGHTKWCNDVAHAEGIVLT